MTQPAGKQLDVHPAANLFPLMDDEAYQALKADIEKNGLREPLTLYQGKILDGRNRLRACEELGLQPFTWAEELEDTDDPIAFVLSKNLHRRHLSPAQRACVAVEALEGLSDAAAERKANGQKSGGRGRKKTSPNSLGRVSHDGEAAAQAAKLLDVNPQYVREAKKISAASPELLAELKSGAVTIPEAKRRLKAAKFTCPNCGGTEADDDGDCAKCREPAIVPTPAEQTGVSEMELVESIDAIQVAVRSLRDRMRAARYSVVVSGAKTRSLDTVRQQRRLLKIKNTLAEIRRDVRGQKNK